TIPRKGSFSDLRRSPLRGKIPQGRHQLPARVTPRFFLIYGLTMSYRKIILIGLALPAIALAVAGVATFTTFRSSAARVPAETFTRAGIEKILARESTVLYSDGKTRVGSFFEGTHRNYLPFDSIPKVLVEALISAEDRNYWTHGGWDVKAFARAMVDNVRDGGRWRGGSTLTQQTAKNLFGRTGPLRGKVDELVNAYRL